MPSMARLEKSEQIIFFPNRVTNKVLSIRSSPHLSLFSGLGQLAGITEQTDLKCHLDAAGEYEYQDRHDYPSAAAIADVLNKNSIIPIFAVENNVREVYDQLRGVIRSAFVTTRTANSDNLLDIIVSQYMVRGQREVGDVNYY